MIIQVDKNNNPLRILILKDLNYLVNDFLERVGTLTDDDTLNAAKNFEVDRAEFNITPPNKVEDAIEQSITIILIGHDKRKNKNLPSKTLLRATMPIEYLFDNLPQINFNDLTPNTTYQAISLKQLLQDPPEYPCIQYCDLIYPDILTMNNIWNTKEFPDNQVISFQGFAEDLNYVPSLYISSQFGTKGNNEKNDKRGLIRLQTNFGNNEPEVLDLSHLILTIGQYSPMIRTEFENIQMLSKTQLILSVSLHQLAGITPDLHNFDFDTAWETIGTDLFLFSWEPDPVY